MKILILSICLIITLEKSLNDIINIRASKLNEAVYDVNFIAYTFYLLHPKAIRLVKNNFDYYYAKFDDNVDDSPKETTSFTQINGSYYYLACTNKYLVMTLYVEIVSNRTKLEKKQSFAYSNEHFSISPNNQKCTIDSINGNYLFVTYVEKKNGKTNYNIFVFNIGSDQLLTYSHNLNFESTFSLSSSYQQTLGCISVITSNYLCLYLENDGLYYLYGNITERNLPSKQKFNTAYKITEMVLTKNHFNPNDDTKLFRYVIGLKDKNGNYYHLPLIVQNTKYEFGSINKISYGKSPSINSFSGFSKKKNDYNPVYFDGSHISIEHITSPSTTLSFKPINSFDVTFSSINQPEVISNTYIIITGWKNSYIYLIDFPNYYDEPKCTSGNMIIGTGVSKTIDIISSAPKIQIPSSLYGIQIKNRDNEVKLSVNSNNKNAVIIGPDKEKISNIPIIFSFYQENISPMKVDYLNTLPNKIESLYYFGNDCTISLSTCYSTCYSCSIAGNSTDNLCDSCKNDYNLDGNNCNIKQKSCKSGYVFYDNKCILCPEPVTSSKKWYYDPSISSTSCLYNSSNYCPFNAKYYSPYLKQCLTKCPKDYPIYNPSKSECVNKCGQDAPYLFEKLLCLDKCPQYSQQVLNKECECYAGLDDNFKNEIKCKEIKCIDCHDLNISEVCKERLMKEYSIENENELIYYKTIILRSNELVNQIEFKIMINTENGIQELNTSLCNDTNFTYTVPINQDVLPINLNETYNDGYDIFNPNDTFYTDPCIIYSIGDSDLTFKQRKKLYKNYAVCESTCTYLNYKPETMSVNCNCRFKKYSKTERTFSSIETSEDFNKTDSISSNLMKCMKSLIKNGALANGAMVTGSAISIGEVSLLIYYLIYNSSMFKSLLGPFMMLASPPQNNSKNDEDDSSDDDYDDVQKNNKANGKVNKINNSNNAPPSALPVVDGNNNNYDYAKPKDNNSNSPSSHIISFSNGGMHNNITNLNYNGNNLINGQVNSNNNNGNKINSNYSNTPNNVNNLFIHQNNIPQNPNVQNNFPDFDINKNEIIDIYMKEKPKFDEDNYFHESKSLCMRLKLNDEIFDYNFDYSKKRKIPFWYYYINLLFYNQMFLFVISKEKWNFFIIKLSLFINLIFFLMLFNTLFMDESLLNEINQKERKLCLGKAMGRIIASVILTILANCILKLLALLRMEFEGINWTKNINSNDEKPHGISRYLPHNQNNNNENSIQNNINRKKEDSSILYYKNKEIPKSTLKKHIFLRTLFYLIISIILNMFITFYVSAFTGMYKNTRINLFFYILIAFLIIMIYPFALCLIVAGSRYYGLKKDKKLYFNISKKLEWIILI